MTDIDDPFAGYEGKLEPYCTVCSDERFMIGPAAEGRTGSGHNCPECNPTPEQAAALLAEWGQTDEEDPF